MPNTDETRTFFFLRFDNKLRPDVTEALVPYFIDRPVLLKTEGALITLFNSNSTHSEINAAVTQLRPHILFFLIEITHANMAFGLGADTANWLASYIEHLHPNDASEGLFSSIDEDGDSDVPADEDADDAVDDDSDEDEGEAWKKPIKATRKAEEEAPVPTLDELLDRLNAVGGFRNMDAADRVLLRRLSQEGRDKKS